MRARIFQQPKSAMQSGMAGAGDWVLEWQPADRRRHDPVMGWFSGEHTSAQVHLRFETRQEAVAYAEREGIAFDLELPPAGRGHAPKVYADNFKFGRAEPWTH